MLLHCEKARRRRRCCSAATRRDDGSCEPQRGARKPAFFVAATSRERTRKAHRRRCHSLCYRPLARPPTRELASIHFRLELTGFGTAATPPAPSRPSPHSGFFCEKARRRRRCCSAATRRDDGSCEPQRGAIPVRYPNRLLRLEWFLLPWIDCGCAASALCLLVAPVHPTNFRIAGRCTATPCPAGVPIPLALAGSVLRQPAPL